MLHIKLTSVMVEDQAKALAFYTDVLGFEKQMDFPVGEYRWITVAAVGRDDLQLALEPNANPACKAFQQAMFEQGIPIASFESTDLDADYKRLTGLGVAYTRGMPVAASEARWRRDGWFRGLAWGGAKLRRRAGEPTGSPRHTVTQRERGLRGERWRCWRGMLVVRW